MAQSTQSFKLFALIGYPLGHTLSPPMHSAALKKVNMPGLYMPFEIEPKNFSRIMKRVELLPLQGFNVTVPYKEKIVSYLDTISPEARVIGAVNTVKKGKKLCGYNTDAYGFSRSLKEDLRFSPRGKKILLIGAGGAARACVYTLAKEGAHTVIISDVVMSKARSLRKHISSHFKNTRFLITQPNEEHYRLLIPTVDCIINATPIGLKKSDPLVISPRIFPKKKLFVYDLIYNPAETKLLAAARKRGCIVSSGLGMLLYQGARAFEIWTGKKAPIASMRKALLDNL